MVLLDEASLKAEERRLVEVLQAERQVLVPRLAVLEQLELQDVRQQVGHLVLEQELLRKIVAQLAVKLVHLQALHEQREQHLQYLLEILQDICRRQGLHRALADLH
jgi:hypothetical protein